MSNTKILEALKELKGYAEEYRGEWEEALCESEDIESYGTNEFIGGKADAYEDAVRILEDSLGLSKSPVQEGLTDEEVVEFASKNLETINKEISKYVSLTYGKPGKVVSTSKITSLVREIAEKQLLAN